jgi:hypothetical protein
MREIVKNLSESNKNKIFQMMKQMIKNHIFCSVTLFHMFKMAMLNVHNQFCLKK